jgi:hypothetical protein
MPLGLNNLVAFILSGPKREQIYFILYVRRIIKITTFGLMVLLCFVMISTNALAEARAPQLVITAFVEALHNDDMAYLMQYVDLDKIKSQPKHPTQPPPSRLSFQIFRCPRLNCQSPHMTGRQRSLESE